MIHTRARETVCREQGLLPEERIVVRDLDAT
jgi:hypothetical protein